jgi:FAS-associated factor 2
MFHNPEADSNIPHDGFYALLPVNAIHVCGTALLQLPLFLYLRLCVLPAGLVRSLLTITAEAPDAATQASQFIAAFTAQYGDTHPAWLASSWRDAATAAYAEFKFLFVYLHAPEHENTDAYVRSVLCNPEVVAYVNSHFLSWGGNVQRPDAFNLAGRLNVSTYPCVALLAFSGSRTKLVAAAQGNVQAQQLLAALRRAVEEQEVMLTAERLEQEERVSMLFTETLLWELCLGFRG